MEVVLVNLVLASVFLSTGCLVGGYRELGAVPRDSSRFDASLAAAHASVGGGGGGGGSGGAAGSVPFNSEELARPNSVTDGRKYTVAAGLPRKDPSFNESVPHNVSALIGKTAFLTCVVHNLGKTKSVTWIRHRDVHILTVGEYTYTTDERFVARHNRATGAWTLVIKYVQERDAGVYECQIPSATPRSYRVNLNVIVPHVRIQGSPDIHVNQGSLINLTCIISYSPEPPAFIFWYRGNEVVAYDSSASRIQVVTESLGRETRSHLVIRNASPAQDSGNYTCRPPIAREATIKVHVIESEFPGALQESGSTRPTASAAATLISCSLALLLLSCGKSSSSGGVGLSSRQTL